MSHYTTLVLALEPEPVWYPKTEEEVFEEVKEKYDYVIEHPNEDEALENFMRYVEEHFGKRIDSRCFELDLTKYRDFIYRDFRNARFNDCKTLEKAFQMERQIMNSYGDYPIVFPDGYYSNSYSSYMAFLFDNFILAHTEHHTMKVYILGVYDAHL